MSKRIVCDACGRDMTDDPKTEQIRLVPASLKLLAANKLPREATIDWAAALGNDAFRDVCRYCIIDGVKRADDRQDEVRKP